MESPLEHGGGSAREPTGWESEVEEHVEEHVLMPCDFLANYQPYDEKLLEESYGDDPMEETVTEEQNNKVEEDEEDSEDEVIGSILVAQGEMALEEFLKQVRQSSSQV